MFAPPSSAKNKPNRLGAVLYALVAVLLTATVLAPPVSAQDQAPVDTPGATLEVEPSTDLVGGTRAVLTGAGFTPNANLLISQCLPAADVIDDCDIGRFGFPSSDSDGSFTTNFNISTTINPNAAPGYDCSTSPAPCVIIGIDSTAGVRARAEITFDPDGVVPPLGTLVVTPSTDLVDRQVIDASLTFDDENVNFFAELRQCQADSPCFEPVFSYISPDGDEEGGTFVRRFLTDGFDCASAPGACVLQARDSVTERVAEAPLSFNPSAPVVEVIASVDPTTDLPYFAPVTVTGTNWTPNNYAYISLCAAPGTDTPTEAAQCRNLSYPFIGDDGTFSTTAALARRISFNFDGELYDCASGAGCVVRVQAGSDPRDVVLIPVSFDPDSVAPEPGIVTVIPSEDLPYVVDVSVIGTLASNSYESQLYQCPAAAAEAGEIDFDNAFSLCRNAGYAYSNFGDGSFQTQITLVREFNPGDGIGSRVDCLIDGCVVSVLSYDYDDDTTSVQHSDPLGFDPDAPAPPPPAIDVSPTTGLADLAELTITGSDIRDGSYVQVRQCIATSCYGANNYVEINQDGSFSTTTSVRRVLDTYGGPADCAVSYECVLQVQTEGQLGSQIATFALDFDPEIPPVARQVMVSTTDNLTDGDEITITATGITPGSSVNVSQCATSGSQSCINYYSYQANTVADAAGTVSIAVEAQRDFYGTLDAVDCAEVTCVLTIAPNDVLSSIEAIDPIELSYDPSVPFEPVTFEVTPNTNLVDGQRVGVVATRWPTDGCCGGGGGGHGDIAAIPAELLVEAEARELAVAESDAEVITFEEFEGFEGNVSFGQCAVVDGQRAECFYGHQEPVEADGTFVSRAFARRFIGDYDCLEVECRLLVETYSQSTGQTFVASSVMQYDPDDLSIIPGLAFVDEGNTSEPVELPVALNRALDEEVTVNYDLVGFGAESGADFAQTSGTITFAPGQTEATIAIQVYDDGAREANEAVLVSFTDPSLGSIGGFGFGGLVIVDNDGGAATLASPAT